MSQHLPSQPVTLLASFFLALLIIPAAALAVSFPNFPEANYYQHYCLPLVYDGTPSTVQGYSVTAIVTNLSDPTDFNQYVFSGSTTCMNGCSYTLGICRPDTFWDNIFFVLFVFGSGLIVWFGRRLGPVGVISTVAIMLISMLNLTWDVFNVPAIITQLLSIAIIVFGAIMIFYPYEHEEKEES